MTFHEQAQTDFKNVILNQSEFAEPITYTPKNGSPRTINAVVVRDRLRPDSQVQANTLTKIFELYIANDSVAGVTEVDIRGDTVAVAEQYGGETITMRVVEVLDKDFAQWHVLVR